jgi:hypothetical protein
MVTANIFILILFAIIISFGVLLESFRVAKKLKKTLPARREDGTRRAPFKPTSFNASSLRSSPWRDEHDRIQEAARRSLNMQRQMRGMQFGINDHRWTFKVVNNNLYANILHLHPAWEGTEGLIGIESLYPRDGSVNYSTIVDPNLDGVAQSQYRGAYRRPIYGWATASIPQAKPIGVLLRPYSITGDNLILTNQEFSDVLHDPALCPFHRLDSVTPCNWHVPIYIKGTPEYGEH